MLRIDPQDPHQAGQITTEGLTYERYQLMVSAIRSLAPEFGNSNGGSDNGSIRHLLVSVPYDEERKKKLDRLVSTYAANSVGFWLDVEALAERWKDIEVMKQDVSGLPAAEEMVKRWQGVLANLYPPGSEGKVPATPQQESEYAVSAMAELVRYALWGFVSTAQLKAGVTANANP
ncbi:Uncharacterised protein [uncultured archaeon]|nr:Uncharacterised protein [uncultured archaeon]